MATILAASITGENATKIIVACLMLIGALFVLGVVIWYYRRRQHVMDATSSAPWTFDELRKLRDEGQLSEEEYQALRASMVEMYTRKPAAAERTRSKSPPEEWDWVAGDDSGPRGFDVKK